MMHSLDLSVCSGTVAMSTSSMKILPPVSGSMRNRATIRLLLPEPVRPAMPTFSRPAMEKLMPLSTSGPSR